MIRHQVPFLNLAFLAPGEFVEHGSQVLPKPDVVAVNSDVLPPGCCQALSNQRQTPMRCRAGLQRDIKWGTNLLRERRRFVVVDPFHLSAADPSR
jgi:hypothetical protein